MKKYLLIACVVIAFVLTIFVMLKGGEQLSPVAHEPPQTNAGLRPHSFADCVAQGYPIQEMQPRRCQAGKIAFIDNAEPRSADIGDGPVVLDALLPNARITSPTPIQGKALGTWFFEGSFPIRILDVEGKVVGETHAQAEANWQTMDYVPFTATLTFTTPSTDIGFVEFAKDNPSGLPDLDASVRIPVRFR